MSGGNQESGRINQILANARRCAVNEALAKARSSYCAAVPRNNKQVPSSEIYLLGKTSNTSDVTRAIIAANTASIPLKGVPESVRIKRLEQDTIAAFSSSTDPQKRFIQYQGPQIQIQCPPLPTEITNAFLPKPSVRCQTLNLLATGSPPNSIPQ
jgi:hypothetical protein